jgi:hypothetical protein
MGGFPPENRTLARAARHGEMEIPQHSVSRNGRWLTETSRSDVRLRESCEARPYGWNWPGRNGVCRLAPSASHGYRRCEDVQATSRSAVNRFAEIQIVADRSDRNPATHGLVPAPAPFPHPYQGRVAGVDEVDDAHAPIIRETFAFS